ncbi:MAG: S8 family serine peptidase, partial [Longimicrobiales bacterium]
MAGVNWRGTLVPIRVFNSNCDWAGTPIQHVQKARQLGARVTNRSAGYEAATRGYELPECAEIRTQFQQLGALFVAAVADTQRQTLRWPARCAFAFSVGASTRANQGAEFNTTENHVMVVAPGVDVSTTGGGANDEYKHIGNSAGATGTSFAAPQAAGVLQVMIAMGIPHDVAFMALWHSATPVPLCDRTAPRTRCKGRINMERALGSSPDTGIFELW